MTEQAVVRASPLTPCSYAIEVGDAEITTITRRRDEVTQARAVSMREWIAAAAAALAATWRARR
jgi:hypothetical protein